MKLNRKVPTDINKDPVNSSINREIKLQGFKDKTLNPMDYINDANVPKADIIKARVDSLREERLRQATSKQFVQGLTNVILKGKE